VTTEDRDPIPARAGDTTWGPSPLPGPTDGDGPHSVGALGGLGRALGPALHELCGDRLGDVDWFQTRWQRSGAATGYTHWRLPDGSVIDAIVKAPVGYREWYWSTKLGETDPMWWTSPEAEHLPVPRVLASGTELGDYDVAWLVVERVSGASLHSELDSGDPERAASALARLFDAAARFHQMTLGVRKPTEHDTVALRDWPDLIERARRAVRDNPVENADDWNAMLRGVAFGLDALVSTWRSRDRSTWCHGDLHPGNVLARPCQTCRLGQGGSKSGADEGVLIDLGLVHAGHWVEDALYLERLYWGRSETLAGVDPVTSLSEARERHGLDGAVPEELAETRRVLMAATSPAFLGQENDASYLAAALAHLKHGASEGLF